MAYVICGIVLMTFVVSIAMNNIVAISLVAPFQLLYLSLLTFSATPHPAYSYLANPLSLTMGYNGLLRDFSRDSDPHFSNIYLNALGTNSLFFSSYNYMFCLQLALIICCFTSLLLKKICRSDFKYLSVMESCCNLVRRAAWMVAIFNLLPVFVSFGVTFAFVRSHQL